MFRFCYAWISKWINVQFPWIMWKRFCFWARWRIILYVWPLNFKIFGLSNCIIIGIHIFSFPNGSLVHRIPHIRSRLKIYDRKRRNCTKAKKSHEDSRSYHRLIFWISWCPVQLSWSSASLHLNCIRGFAQVHQIFLIWMIERSLSTEKRNGNRNGNEWTKWNIPLKVTT